MGMEGGKFEQRPESDKSRKREIPLRRGGIFGEIYAKEVGTGTLSEVKKTDRKSSIPEASSDGESENRAEQRVPRKDVPMHFIFGNHGAAFDKELENLDTAITHSLENTSGDVVVVVESVSMSSSHADVMKRLEAAGYPPSISYAYMWFLGEHGRFPDQTVDDPNEIFASFRTLSPFTKKEFLLLDKHFEASNRIRVLWETRPDDRYSAEMD